MQVSRIDIIGQNGNDGLHYDEKPEMKIQIYSDLHLEFGHDTLPEWDGESKVLVLAGDIHLASKLQDYTDILAVLKANGWEHVILIGGNHELYNGTYPDSLEDLKVKSEELGVIFLDNSSVEIEGVTFFGGTMWTPLDNDPQLALTASLQMNDYRIIKNFNTTNATDEFYNFVAALEDLDKTKPTVIVSHMAPHETSIANHYRSSNLNGAYFVDMSEFMTDNIKYWIHGHVHNSVDYVINKTRVVSNPFGYLGFGYDEVNPEFDRLGLGITITAE